MKKEKYGFVYIWYDTANSKQNGPDKIKRFYIGCHWGTDFDGYICSSTWMRDAYHRRPEDFKRRLLKTNITTKEETINEEYKWLSLIRPEELGKRYYNLRNKKCGNFGGGEKGRIVTEETRRKQSEAKKGQPPWNKGKPHSEEHRNNLKKNEKEKQEISERMMDNKRWLGKNHKQEAKDKVSAARKGKPLSPDHCNKLSESHKGYRWKTNELGKRVFYRESA